VRVSWADASKRIWRYLAAAAFVGCALGARLLLSAYVGSSDRLAPFYRAILGSSLLGLGPGALAVVSSLLAVWYFFIPPFWSFAVDAGALPDLLVFALTAALLLAICEVYRRERAVHLRDYQLFRTVQEILSMAVWIRAYPAARGKSAQILP